jgi:hypothetical protein
MNGIEWNLTAVNERLRRNVLGGNPTVRGFEFSLGGRIEKDRSRPKLKLMTFQSLVGR